MTLLSVVKDVCLAVGVAVPQSVFSNITGNRTMLEMLSLANEMAQRTAYDFRDWQRLIKTATVTGDGIATAFDLPADFQRMTLTANVWHSIDTIQPMLFVADADEWMRRRADSQYSSWGEWTMMGGQIHIAPTLGAGSTASFIYLDKNCVGLSSGGYGQEFMNDADTYVLSERLLKLGMIWQWKANKGGAYAEDMSTYGDALNSIAGRDKPAPILIGRRVLPTTINASYPYPMP